MSISPVTLGLVIGGALFLANRKKKKDAASASSSSQQVLDAVSGPEPDPCLGVAYSQFAQPLIKEIDQNLKPEARMLYGGDPVYFLTPEAQGIAFTRLTSYMVNEPQVDPVSRVAQDMAPGCDWLESSEQWSPAMVAFRNSLEKMTQVIQLDLGNLPQLWRPHAWDEDTWILRNGRQLNLVDGSLVGFELPPGEGDLHVQAIVSPANSGTLDNLGVNMQALPVPGDPSKYTGVQVMHVRPKLTGPVTATYELTATRNGSSTSGRIVVRPKGA